MPDEPRDRLYRFRDARAFAALVPSASPDLVSVFDAEKNLVLINRDLFERLDDIGRSEVLRAAAPHVWAAA
jgi:hypothetical protein